MINEKDFTPAIHKKLLVCLLEQGYDFQTFSGYLNIQNKVSKVIKEKKKLIILRHDVELYYKNALELSRIQSKLGITGTYFFRILPRSFQQDIVKQIADLGHEIGYHYDDLAICRGDYQKAYNRFQRNLGTLRKIAPVVTMSMDGSPLSRYDNRDLWQKYDYKKLGILAEPYFDLNFNQIFYITDTGRRWDGHLFNVRDKATKENPVTNEAFLKLRFHSTFDMIEAIERRGELEKGGLRDLETGGVGDLDTGGLGDKERERTSSQHEPIFPRKAMLNFHPQRWNSNPYLWTKELILQNAKNQVKRFLVK